MGSAVLMGEKPAFDYFKELLMPGINPELVIFKDSTQAPQEIYLKSQPISATTKWEERRNPFEDLLATLVSFLWEYYKLPRDSVIEYGPGATGYYDAVLRPKDIKNWLQVEINPLAIEENKRRNPNASIVQGSCHNIPYRNVPLITGLSSFDVTDNLRLAISQVANALSQGGYFLHIQDVTPSIDSVRSYIRLATGKDPDYAINYDGGSIGFVLRGEKVPIVNIFQESMKDAVQASGLELIANSFATIVDGDVKNPNFKSYYFSQITQVGESPSTRDLTALVTLAKKKNR